MGVQEQVGEAEVWGFCLGLILVTAAFWTAVVWVGLKFVKFIFG